MIRSRKRFEEWLPACFDGEFGWDFLSCAFSGTKIMPMDFDAVVERNGHFLIMETKEKGKKIDTGQSITLTRLWKKDGFTILHIEGKTAPSISGVAVYSEWDETKEARVGDKEIIEKNAVDLAFIVRCWFCKSSGIAMPSRAEFERCLWIDDYSEASNV